MPRRLSVIAQSFPIAGKFTISRGAKTQAEVIMCEIAEGSATGRGECVPYRRYGESMESVTAAVESVRREIEAGASIAELQELLPAGAARNALDCALWDLRAKTEGRPASALPGLRSDPVPLPTAYTISLGSPEEMAAQTRRNAHRPLLKIKVGGDGDIERLQAVCENAPGVRIIVDANEGWSAADIEEKLDAAARLNVVLVEQPLPAGDDRLLRDIHHPVPICADESVHVAGDLAALEGLYDAVNIKLDKSGGLTAALALRQQARAMGFDIMVGCMVGTSLAMAPAVLLAQDADFVDLDGPLLLAQDRTPGLVYSGSLVSPPTADLWG
jgi:L-alanine-DL-glutamate epimerase-like enolase superfamily enzyme